MDPLLRHQPAENPGADDQVASLAATVVISATQVSPDRIRRRDESCGWEEDAPTSEVDVLAAVTTTRREIAAGRLGPRAVLDLVCRRTQFLTDAAGVVIERLDRTELVYAAAAGVISQSLGLRVDTQRSLSGLCLRTGEVMVCDDAAKDGRVDGAACRWAGIRSMVLVPVLLRGAGVGVLAITSPAVAAFGQRDVWVTRLMADLLAEPLDELQA
jgi:putative methionine-R-sulfoxide reductase with GAF domain